MLSSHQGKVIESGPHAGKPYVYRVVLTGGPCGGKSSSLQDFSVANMLYGPRDGMLN